MRAGRWIVRGTRPERALEQIVRRSGALESGERVLVACSGGSDSVGLAALCAAISKPLRLRLTLAHVNHGLRRSAWQDEAVVLRVSAALELPVRICAIDPGAMDEASLRDARYDALVRIARDAGARVVATAHNAEDQTETVLLALFRGTGSKGLGGMALRRKLADGIDLARPLLRSRRSDIRAYVQRAGLPYAVDPTNADESFRRNAVRAALTALRPLFPGLDEAVSRATEVIDAERSAGPVAELRRHVRQTLHREQALRDVDFEHVEAAVRALRLGRSGRFVMAPGVELKIERGALTVHRKER